MAITKKQKRDMAIRCAIQFLLEANAKSLINKKPLNQKLKIIIVKGG
tara:strand:+ start:183 stop:323 length:141 start_codon:yes stop_codon:yes gene_type:complete